MAVGVQATEPQVELPEGMRAVQSQAVAGKGRTETTIDAASRKELDRGLLEQAWAKELGQARAARAAGAAGEEWRFLERAHILSQPLVVPHVRTHLAMLGAGLRRHDRREVVGQLARLVLAGPGSLSGRYPVGNSGGADVSAFVPMPVPEDLRPLLEGRPQAAS